MNLTTLAHVASSSNERPDPQVALLALQAIRPYRARRERDFGIGYGSSSGYASGKRYTSDWAAPRFRFS